MKNITRKELFDKVWEQPMTKVAPTLGLSDVGLAKVCRKYEIPRPPVGYWAKLAHGKKVDRPELPELDDDDLNELISFRENFENEQPEVSKPRIIVEVPEKLAKPHPHVSTSKNGLIATQPNANGIVDSPESGCLNINVSKQSLPRALRIFDSIIKAWENEGGEVQLRPTMFCLGEDGVCVSLNEAVRRFEKNPDKDRRWKDWSYEPNGKLSLEIDDYGVGLRKNWKDGKVQVIETVLGNFISTLHDWMENEKSQRLDQECSDRQTEKAQKRRATVKEKKEFEQARRNDLMAYVESWEKAQRIRKYLDAVDKTLELKEIAPSKPEELALWLEWARWYADDTCPLTPSRPRNQSIEIPENCLVADLDLTSGTKQALESFPEVTTDELYQVTKDEFRKRCDHCHWTIWREVTLVLEGLGYDVSQRDTSYW